MIICKGVVVETGINCNRCFRWHQEAYDECTIVQNEGFSFLFLDFGSLTVSNKRKSIIACQREKMWYQKSKNRNHIEDYDDEGQKETSCGEDFDEKDLDKKRPGVRKTGTKCCLTGRVLTLASSKHLQISVTSVISNYSWNHRNTSQHMPHGLITI